MNKFNMLRTKRKDVKSFNKNDELSLRESILKEYEYVHVPPEAYSKISHLKEYEYLKKGLLFPKELLHRDDNVLMISDKEFTWGEYVKEVSWYEAKELARKLGGHIPTPAEYFCTVKWLKENDLESIISENKEWLDGIFQRRAWGKPIGLVGAWDKDIEYSILTHTDVKGKKTSGGIKRTVPNINGVNRENLFYSFDDIDIETGMPEKFSGGHLQYHEEDKTEDCALIKAFYEGRHVLFNGIVPDNDNFMTGLRLCYKVLEK